MILVFRDKYLNGWPEHEQGERAYELELGAALERRYKSDAHFVQYTSPKARRLNVAAIGQTEISIGVIVFDCDGPNHQADEEWRQGFREKIAWLEIDHPSPFVYETRGGFRVVFRLPKPFVIAAPWDAATWSGDYLLACAYLRRHFDIEADRGCKDFTRLFRLPFVRREGTNEQRPTIGDPHQIGVLEFTWTNDDARLAESWQRPRSKERENFDHDSNAATSGNGVLYELLNARGDVGRACRGGWIVKCPNRKDHTTNTDGTTSTLLYPPDRGGELGFINCLHSHCQDLDPVRALHLFSDQEIATARARAAGKV